MASPDRFEPSEAVVEAVADAENVSPWELAPPLAYVVDPDALDSLFARPETDGVVRFRYCGYTVSVLASGAVDVRAAT
ncbi:HalOD1 output domain-containing protein (plasmid) [Haloarcula salina]|uniref:HalOD1 output domain-containing protein n=1 Tax=Haloarcula salina TaxID=1429914 RepID=UPI003C6FB796